MSIWYYYLNEEKLGPVVPEALWSLYQEGQINCNTQLWCQGMAQWLPMHQVPGFGNAKAQSQLSQVMSQPSSYPALPQRVVKQVMRTCTTTEFNALISEGLMKIPVVAVLPLHGLTLKDGRTFQSEIFLLRRPSELVLVLKAEQGYQQIHIPSWVTEQNNEQGSLLLTLSCPDHELIDTCEYQMRESEHWHGGAGLWQDLWLPGIRQQMGIAVEDSASVHWGTFRQWGFASQSFQGMACHSEHAFLGVVDSQQVLSTWPALPEVIHEGLSSATWWPSGEDCFWVHEEKQGLKVFQLTWQTDHENPNHALIQKMDPKLQLNDPREFHQSTGSFSVHRINTQCEEDLLLRWASGVVECWADLSSLVGTFSEGVYYEGACLLYDHGDVVFLEVADEATQALLSQMQIPQWRDALDAATPLTVMKLDQGRPRPCTIQLTEESFILDASEVYLFAESEMPVVMESVSSSDHLVTLRIGAEDSASCTVLMLPRAWADQIRRVWDVRGTRLRVSDYGLGKLYTEYASVRKRSFLMGLFWDLKLLDHSLDRGIRLEELLAKIQEYDDRALLKDKQLMTQVFEKIQLLSANLPQIRQQTEVFTSMFPYHWIQKDEEWLTSIFGPHIARQMIEREQKQTMNRVRHEIRKSQSHYQRALNMIENSMRPLEQYYDREAMEKHWSSRMKKFAPLAITGAVGIGMTLATGGMGAPMFLAGASGAAVSNMMGSFEKNNNFRTTLKRSCQEILSWWTVYRRVIAVAIYEADQFMIEENLRCSKRDRQLIDQLAPEQKKKVLGNIAFRIRKQLCENADFRHEKIYEGSQVNVGALMVELESEYQTQMEENLAQFSQVNASKGELE